MSLGMINDTTLTQFVEEEELFETCVTKFFQTLDIDEDGTLSRDELRGGFRSLLGYEYQNISVFDDFFERFDSDQDGNIGRDVFGSLMKELMLAMARGIGKSPVLVALASDSFLAMAVQHEIQSN